MLNAIIEDPRDDSLIVSMRAQNAGDQILPCNRPIEVDSWSAGELGRSVAALSPDADGDSVRLAIRPTRPRLHPAGHVDDVR